MFNLYKKKGCGRIAKRFKHTAFGRNLLKFMEITVIDNNNLRGVLAPAKLLTKELLGDILDLIAYSKPKISAEINRGFKKASKESLIDGKELKRSLGIS